MDRSSARDRRQLSRLEFAGREGRGPQRAERGPGRLRAARVAGEGSHGGQGGTRRHHRQREPHLRQSARPAVPVSARLAPLALLLLAAHPARGETGLLRDVVFADYTPLSINLELARRLLTPLAAATLPQQIGRAHV